MNKIETEHQEMQDRNEAFLKFLEKAEEAFNGLKIRNSEAFKEYYKLNFIINGNPKTDFPISAKLFYGSRPFAHFEDESSVNNLSEYGASLYFNQQPDSMVSILLHYPYVNNNSSFNGLDLGTVSPHQLLKESYQKRLFHVLVTTMQNYSFAGSPSFIDKRQMGWYNARYRQIKDGNESESRIKSTIWSLFKWAVSGLAGGFLAGFAVSTFPTKLKDSQFERYDTVLIQSKEELSSVKQELSNITEGLNKQLDSLNQTIRETGETMFEEIKQMNNKVSSK